MNYKKNPVLDNIYFALIYWGLSHLNWMLFNQLGVLPMPIWPAAGIAMVGAFYRGWKIAPGLAVGAFLSNYFSLEAPLGYALLIPIMNTLGPLAGAGIMRLRLSEDFNLKTIGDVLFLFLGLLVVAPALTATGGIGFKLLLGLISREEFFTSWLKWNTAHAFGTLLIGIPLFAWIRMGRRG